MANPNYDLRKEVSEVIPMISGNLLRFRELIIASYGYLEPKKY